MYCNVYCTYNDEIAGVHRGRDLAVVGTMADELAFVSTRSPHQPVWMVVSYAGDQIVAFNRVFQLDGSAVACRSDFGKVRHFFSRLISCLVELNMDMAIDVGIRTKY